MKILQDSEHVFKQDFGALERQIEIPLVIGQM